MKSMTKKVTPTWYRRLEKHERGKGRWKYIVLENMRYKTSIRGVHIDTEYITLKPDGRLYGKIGYAWDGPSGPTFDTPTNMRASLFHDALVQLINEGKLDWKYRKYADGLLRTHMLEDQAIAAEKMTGWKRALYLRWGRFRANGYYLAVRAWSRFKGM